MSIFETLGTTIGLEDANSPAAFTTIANVVSINGVGWTANNVDVTMLQSAAREFRQTIKDGGTVTIGIQYDPQQPSQVSVRDLPRGNRNYRVTLPSSPSESWTFSAGVQGFALGDMTVDGIQNATITLKVSGAYAIA